MRGAESSIHMDLRRGEDEEIGWEREVGAAAPWAAGDDVGRRREEREIEGERVGGGGSLGVKEMEGVECLYIYICVCENYH